MYHKSIFKSALTVLVFLFAISSAHAQEEINHSLKKGSNALQFRIANNFTLDSFRGATFSYKRHVTAAKAHRYGLTVNTTYQDTDFPDQANNPNFANFDLNLNFNFSWMNYVDIDAPVKFYYGYGPGVTFGFDRDEFTTNALEDTNKDRLFGLSGLLYGGVEWFFHPSISIHAEYTASAFLNFNKETEKTVDTANGNVLTDTEVNSTSLGITADNVLFGISVYF